ncbi:hypothetical protein KABACHOK_01600 [Brevundimonas phage vB_BpoS-Kabachok]|uniref:Uncharacterized protein n=1 Tax=Brevundimonas phage vB_BpoS-Kabachok TaxID=2948600 RepID=A0A9E7MNM8_9CAUD|nr:hypothetical protein KABACHOK_01600 [Brevundimonas phage vB_BpoS-Kabachok]
MQTPNQTQTSEGVVTPVAMAELLASQQRLHDRIAESERLKAKTRLTVAVNQAKLDTAQMMRQRANEAYARGGYAPAMLTNDPYRDTSATLAEVRTNCFALKLTVDSVDFTYDVEGFVKAAGFVRADAFAAHRISRHFDDLDEAHRFFDDACSRFFRILDFRTQVDF